VKTFKENKTTNYEKAAASLFVLSFCSKEDLESNKGNVANFCVDEIIPLIKNPSTDLLLLFRSIWVYESFWTFLPEEKQKEVV
jgi:hypothetical protein